MFSSCKKMGVFLAFGLVVVVIIECCLLVPPLGFPRIYEGWSVIVIKLDMLGGLGRLINSNQFST